jgi:predicted RNase H-like HicB family nuclease
MVIDHVGLHSLARTQGLQRYPWCAKEAEVMRYRIAVHQSEEGFSVSVPGLPGCWSQGNTEAEALENIKGAIREYLAVVDDQRK